MISRLVSGLGKSITIVYLTDICRSTSIAERTPVLLVFNIAFQIGIGHDMKTGQDMYCILLQE